MNLQNKAQLGKPSLSLAKITAAATVAMFAAAATFQADALANTQADQSGLTFLKSAAEAPVELQNQIEATGLVKVFPFRKKKKFVQCTGTHIGEGYVLTAGHCFFGSLDCNNATVNFGFRDNEQVIGKCVQVMMNEAAGSSFLSSRNDFAIFKVDNHPDAFVDMDKAIEPTETGSLVSVSFPRSLKKKDHVVAISQNCSLRKLTGNDLLDRPRSKSTVLHDCLSIAGMNGALILQEGTLAPMALHQAGSIEPSSKRSEETGNSNVRVTDNNVAQAVSRIQPLARFNTSAPGSETQQTDGNFVIETPRSIRIGSHIAEAFPLGVKERVKMKVGSFQAAEGSSTVSVSVETGTDTMVHIVDGDGQKHTFYGVGYFEQTLTKQYASPVAVSLETVKKANSFFAHIKVSPATM